MKINFNQQIMKIGKDGPLTKPNSTEPFCLKDAAIEVLLVYDEGETGEQKAKRGVLAMRIYANPGDIDLDLEELAKIKQLIGKGYGPLVVVQAWKMLENKKSEV